MLHITPWDQAALQLLANGTAADEIVGRLGIGEPDVDGYLRTLFAKMGAASRSEAIAAAFRRGLLAVEGTVTEVA